MAGRKKPIVIGQKYGRLSPVRYDTSIKKWLCICECGKQVAVRAAALNNGNTKSCGCFNKDAAKVANTTHGISDTKIHCVWRGMKQRCSNKNNKSYKHYGGRGISVCDKWRDSFESFYKWALDNGYHEGLQLDRIDNDGNYCPENCRWATPKENNSHRRLVRNEHGQYASVQKQG